MRLALFRRSDNPVLGLIRSLVYYRAVFDSLTPEDLHPGYFTYLASSYERRAASAEKDAALPDHRNHAVFGRR